MSASQRAGDYEWVLWTTRPDGSTQILARVFAPTIREARAHWGEQREHMAISSLLSYRTMTPLPKPPREGEDYTHTVRQSVKVRPGQFHPPTRVKKGFNARTADRRSA